MIQCGRKIGILYKCFLFLLLLFIFLLFAQYRLQEQAHSMGIDVRDIVNNPVSLVLSYIRLFLVLLSILLMLLKRPRISVVGKSMLAYACYLFVVSIFTPQANGVVAVVNIYTTMSLWIYVYFVAYLYVTEYGFNAHLDKLVLLLFVYTASLLSYNYYYNNRIGHNDWHFIEAYFMIAILPICLFVAQGKSQKWYVVIAVCLVVLSMKRTGLLALLFGLAFQYLYKDNRIGNKVKSVFVLCLSSALVYFLLLLAFPDTVNAFVERFSEIGEDGGSGRFDMFPVIWDAFKQAPVENKLLGHGYNMVIDKLPFGYSAHNEYLEILFDFGILGAMIYLSVLFSIIRLSMKVKHRRFQSVIFMSLLICLIMGLGTHLTLFPTFIICFSLFWGIADASVQQKLFMK